jgi:hypothetical protein
MNEVILWINGAFGVGKTTTASLVREREPTWHLFDPEWVGFTLRANLGDVGFNDFQDLTAWRTLVPVIASEIASLTSGQLLAVQTVLVERYWAELLTGFAERDLSVFHVVLDADEAMLRERILADQEERTAESWRVDHITAYLSARTWMTGSADLVIDTTAHGAVHAASQILDALAARGGHTGSST